MQPVSLSGTGPRGCAPRPARSAAAGAGPVLLPVFDGLCWAARPGGWGGLLHDDVGVGAADPERGHRRGRGGARCAGQGTGSVSSRTVPADQSMWGLGRSTCRVGGSVSWLRAWIILIIPATPAAAWVWPMLDLIDPSQSGWSAVRAGTVGGEQGAGLDRVAQGGAGAVGLHDVHLVRARPALATAWRMTRCWAGPLGAVNPLEAPSWLTAVPGDHRQHLVAVGAGVAEAVPAPKPRPLRPSRCRQRRRRTPCTARRGPARAGGRTR